jgi:YihY family inner membrane protein
MVNLASFSLVVLKSFRANQGLLLAGAVAYYALLSIIPLLILFVIGFSHFVDEVEVLLAIARYVEWVAPGQGKAIVGQLSSFFDHKGVVGGVLLVTMIFFSSLAFSVLESAMSVIFLHRLGTQRRHFLVSLSLPYFYMLVLGVALLAVTLVGVELERIDNDTLSRVALYAMGLLSEVLIITSIYYVMPVGRLTFRHALLGGATATFLWEITRQVLRVYFGSLSQVTEVYGSFATAIVILLSFEFGAILLLLGAQVIAEYERLQGGGPEANPGEPVTLAGREAPPA